MPGSECFNLAVSKDPKDRDKLKSLIKSMDAIFDKEMAQALHLFKRRSNEQPSNNQAGT